MVVNNHIIITKAAKEARYRENLLSRFIFWYHPAFQHLKDFAFLDLVTHQKLPGRLGKFTENEISDAYRKAFETLKGSSTGRAGIQPFSMA